MMHTLPKEKPIYDPLSDVYLDLKPFITPNDRKVAKFTEETLGTEWDSKLNVTDVFLLQTRIAGEINLSYDSYRKPPGMTLQDGGGNHISRVLLLYSAILNEELSADAFILKIDAANASGFWNHYAVLVIFGNKAMICDTSIPLDKLGFVCRPNTPDRVVTDIIQNTDIIQYNVKAALSENERQSFADNNRFFDWLLYKTGY